MKNTTQQIIDFKQQKYNILEQSHTTLTLECIKTKDRVTIRNHEINAIGFMKG